MATQRVLVDATRPQVRETRKRAPKPWIVTGSKTTPTFETCEGNDVAVGYELQPVPDNPSKLTFRQEAVFLPRRYQLAALL